MISKTLYIYSRKLHRIILLAVSTLILIMGVTGLAMKYPQFSQVLHLDLGMLRYIHNQLSLLFVIVLGAMMLTGLYLYFYPIYLKRRTRLSAAPLDPTIRHNSVSSIEK